jgi:DNA-binding transcriptional regulator YhcF (GntR family)
MAAMGIDQVFDAALRIHLLQDRAVTITFTPSDILVKFPTTRSLAEFLKVPHYYVLPYFGMMEQEQLVTRAERVGILTTPRGTRKYLELMNRDYRQQAIDILGEELLARLTERAAKTNKSVDTSTD